VSLTLTAEPLILWCFGFQLEQPLKRSVRSDFVLLSYLGSGGSRYGPRQLRGGEQPRGLQRTHKRHQESSACGHDRRFSTGRSIPWTQNPMKPHKQSMPHTHDEMLPATRSRQSIPTHERRKTRHYYTLNSECDTIVQQSTMDQFAQAEGAQYS